MVITFLLLSLHLGKIILKQNKTTVRAVKLQDNLRAMTSSYSRSASNLSLSEVPCPFSNFRFNIEVFLKQNRAD